MPVVVVPVVVPDAAAELVALEAALVAELELLELEPQAASATVTIKTPVATPTRVKAHRTFTSLPSLSAPARPIQDDSSRALVTQCAV